MRRHLPFMSDLDVLNWTAVNLMLLARIYTLISQWLWIWWFGLCTDDQNSMSKIDLAFYVSDSDWRQTNTRNVNSTGEKWSFCVCVCTARLVDIVIWRQATCITLRLCVCAVRARKNTHTHFVRDKENEKDPTEESGRRWADRVHVECDVARFFL